MKEALVTAEPPTAAPGVVPPSFMRQHRGAMSAALIALAMLGALAVRLWIGPQAGTDAVLWRDFVQTVVAAIRAPVTGTLIARAVEVGDVVQPGRALMTLSPRGLTQLVVQIDDSTWPRVATRPSK